ncbi:MAG: hypothetical protein HONBIEJF_02020 [Fimbriimonadaceae bacterium]|nr:hypothetical protein [Fimbriimonadaceae bacterium]
MEYYVLGADGNKYGPADVPTLNTWAQEGRVLPTTLLEDFQTGQKLQASAVVGMQFPGSGAIVGMPDAPQMPGIIGTPIQAPKTADPDAPLYQGYGTKREPTLAELDPTASTFDDPDDNLLPFALQGGFNIGAFVLTWIWGLNHKQPVTLIALVLGLVVLIPAIGCIASIAQLGFMIYCGTKGNQWAWESGRFSTPEECLAVQKVWMYWGMGIFFFSCLVIAPIFAVMDLFQLFR